MKPVEIGAVGRCFYDTLPEHSAEAVGNIGVDVVSSATLIWFVENACEDAIRNCYEDGEVTIGVGFKMEHLAPAAIGTRVEAVGTVVAVDGRSVDFEIQAFDDGRLLMSGGHRRVGVHLDRFLKKNGLA